VNPFPWILVFLNVCAAFTYSWQGNYRLTVYWLAAAVLTTTVTL
jgi:hypothetical protein